MKIDVKIKRWQNKLIFSFFISSIIERETVKIETNEQKIKYE